MRILLLMLVGCLGSMVFAEEPVLRTWTIDGQAREALVAVPTSAKKEAAPVVFVFHGHGGRAQMMARRFAIHAEWPEAIVVYPQGLPTPAGKIDPDGKMPGWQVAPGQQGDRDLKFFDAMLESLRKDYKVDDKRIYSTGHSNGGYFTYLLWAQRGDQLAAVAPCAATCGPLLRKSLKPKPAFHLAGEKDPLVKFEMQQATMNAIKELNQGGEGKPWEKQCTLYASKNGTPFVTLIHPGGHELPKGSAEIIVKFFKEFGKGGG